MSKTITAQDARIKAEQIVLQQKPFIMVSLEAENHASFLVHVGGDDITDEQRATNRKRLDFNFMEFTNHIHPSIKMAWVMQDIQNKMGGNNNEEG